MKAISQDGLTVEVRAYADLQRTMHDALLVQHPEWIGRDGKCPKCDDYDRRLAELLSFSVAFERAQERADVTAAAKNGSLSANPAAQPLFHFGR